MDESEFRQLLELFPVVRPRDYHVELDSSRQSSQSAPSEEAQQWQDAWSTEDRRSSNISKTDNHEAFWRKLKSAAEQKVGAADAERFCKAFQQVYKKLVYEELTMDAAKNILNSRSS
ncbi:hypothetical protein ABFS82_04G066900 [Erythranthe guttata]|uniref:Uncharacterized protein n=1 Tax=Erythranthe guttata TaxID=4155 RepID=A0A022S075_ERYGU|nr:PREDICTED: uncharacterized protein LOC105975114 [Erythranthe guttata]EYU46177.1 hypothetical protein MIMGU_mgv1a016559mg [Erythranthe guttata]|eukprot:XP_012855775.1 PREDICTED: uncharacterized protein LOC105975114 [Erythranthe guttata]